MERATVPPRPHHPPHHLRPPLRRPRPHLLRMPPFPPTHQHQQASIRLAWRGEDTFLPLRREATRRATKRKPQTKVAATALSLSAAEASSLAAGEPPRHRLPLLHPLRRSSPAAGMGMWPHLPSLGVVMITSHSRLLSAALPSFSTFAEVPPPAAPILLLLPRPPKALTTPMQLFMRMPPLPSPELEEAARVMMMSPTTGQIRL